ncbi:hypothetical protein D3C85_1331750 [compost metagenome]
MALATCKRPSSVLTAVNWISSLGIVSMTAVIIASRLPAWSAAIIGATPCANSAWRRADTASVARVCSSLRGISRYDFQAASDWRAKSCAVAERALASAGSVAKAA